MIKELQTIFAGFGGQGILFTGKVMAYAGMLEGRELSWLPSYGPEMRGGTANCSVIISEEEIASPLCNEPDVLIAMNSPSFHKFTPRVKKGGIVIVNGSMSDCYAGRDDIAVYDIAANDLAMEAGDIRSANIVILGALCRAAQIVKDKSIINCLNEKFVGKPALMEINERAFKLGKEAAEKK